MSLSASAAATPSSNNNNDVELQQQQQQQQQQPQQEEKQNSTHQSPITIILPENQPTANSAAAIVDEDDIEKNRSHFPLLYSSYFFAAWGDRMWEFAVIVFLMELFPTTLFPSSLFGFCENIAGITFGGAVGRYIDSHDRLTVMRTSIVGQNVVIFIASIIFVMALSRNNNHQQNNNNSTGGGSGGGSHFFVDLFVKNAVDPFSTFALFLIIASGMVAKTTSSMNKISIHKDWAVILAAGDSSFQTILNTNLRRVDLSCSILAPLAVGVLSSAISPSFALIFIATWSFCSLFIEMFLSNRVYQAIPMLQKPKKSKKPLPTVTTTQHEENSDDNSSKKKSDQEKDDTFSLLKAYIHHPIFPVSLAYGLLYISLLSFGGIMIAYLRTLGCSDALLAGGRGLAATVAIGSTFAVPHMIKGLGLFQAAKLSSWLQVGALAPLALVFLNALSDPDHSIEKKSASLFITVIFISICCSRFGLWAFDLCQTQIMQESVDLDYAGRVNGVQEMLCNVCYLFGFVMTMVADDPREFAGPALCSFGAIFLAALIFSFMGEKASQVAAAAKAVVDERKKKEKLQQQ